MVSCFPNGRSPCSWRSTSASTATDLTCRVRRRGSPTNRRSNRFCLALPRWANEARVLVEPMKEAKLVMSSAREERSKPKTATARSAARSRPASVSGRTHGRHCAVLLSAIGQFVRRQLDDGELGEKVHSLGVTYIRGALVPFLGFAGRAVAECLVADTDHCPGADSLQQGRYLPIRGQGGADLTLFAAIAGLGWLDRCSRPR
jgi:hypothetical protein